MEKQKPDAPLAKVAYEISSKGENTNLTTKLPEKGQLIYLSKYLRKRNRINYLSFSIKIVPNQNQSKLLKVNTTILIKR